ncbi:MAG: hypothetical protein IKM51_01390 [Oscillospiraceae bacterium]|nr:hypothetical protein [Oscillospiraceae bacterium]
MDYCTYIRGRRRSRCGCNVSCEIPRQEKRQVIGPRFCPTCSAPTEGAKFCRYCGSKL